MTAILRWFGCYPQEQKYHSLHDDSLEPQKIKQGPKQTSVQGDETYDALKAWEIRFPKDKCEIGDALKTYEFAQRVLNALLESHALSPSNTDEIGCHLWAMAKTSESKIGSDSMFRYFFDKLPQVLGNENRDIAAKIRCAMIGSGNRKRYTQS